MCPHANVNRRLFRRRGGMQHAFMPSSLVTHSRPGTRCIGTAPIPKRPRHRLGKIIRWVLGEGDPFGSALVCPFEALKITKHVIVPKKNACSEERRCRPATPVRSCSSRGVRSPAGPFRIHRRRPGGQILAVNAVLWQRLGRPSVALSRVAFGLG